MVLIAISGHCLPFTCESCFIGTINYLVNSKELHEGACYTYIFTMLETKQMSIDSPMTYIFDIHFYPLIIDKSKKVLIKSPSGTLFC